MHIETLKVFCDLVETGSFSRAAAQNFVTQSAVSQQIRGLEEKYGRKLIERTKGHVRLTPKGEVLYRIGKDIVQQYGKLAGRIAAMANVVAGTVRVATVYSVGLYELSGPLKKYLQAFPEVNVHLEYSRSNKIYEDVVHGNIDLGLVAYPAKRPQTTVIPFREDRLVLICPPHHSLARWGRISFSQLNGERFIGFERDIPTRKAVDRILRRKGVRVHYAVEMDNIETIKRVVEIGSGVAIVPEPAVLQEIKGRTVRAVHFSDETLLRPLGIIYKRGKHLSPAVEKFVEFLKEK